MDFPQQVLLHAGPPVLVVPHAGAHATAGSRILVAWKDTREAARAMRDSLPFLCAAERVLLVEIGGVPCEPECDEAFAAASAWLGAHQVAFDAHREIALAEIGAQLLTRAAAFDADLVVSGGYGHSRLREWVLGGVTRHLLMHMTVPTLFSH